MNSNVQPFHNKTKNETISQYFYETTDLLYNAKKTTLKHFELLKVIEKGTFSELHMVKNIHSDTVYTMKILKKKDLIARNACHQEIYRDLIVNMNHPFLVTLHDVFKDDVHLYLVMECYAGDLRSLLITQHVLTEKQTKFYIAEIAAAINVVHEFDYIHRDLKPDNILITNSGHIKLRDVGITKGCITKSDELISKYQKSKHNITLHENDIDKKHDRNRTSVAVADYIAPEVFSMKGYDKLVDWWSIGVIMFECLIGYTPFHQDDPLHTCRKIIRYRKYFKIPNDAKISRDGVDLMHNLICSYRRRYSFQQIKKHSFLKNIEWDDLMLMKQPFFVIDKIDILIFGYIQMMVTKLNLSCDFPHDIIKLILSIHGETPRYISNGIL